MSQRLPYDHPLRASSSIGAGVRGVGLVLLTAILFPVATFGTNGIEPIDTSLQARIRGGVDVAVGDSALSQIDNPASLARYRAPRFDFSGQMCFPSAHWYGPLGHSQSEINVVPLGNIAIAIPLDERLTLGLAMHSKAGLASRYHMRHLLIPFMKRRVGTDAKMIGLHCNLGYQLTDRLSVGVGVRGEVATSEFSMVLGPADAEFGRGYAYGGGFQLGLQYRATDDLTLGLAYRSPSWFGDLAGGNARVSLFGVLPIGLGAARIEKLHLAQKITAGAAWDVTDWLKVAGEVRWINYRDSSFDSLTVATDGVLDLRIPLPLGYQDQWVFALGTDIKLAEHWTLGLGYNYGTDPVKRSSLLPMGSTIAQHHITTGLRYERDNWWVGAGYILGMHASMSGGGHSHIPLGIDYGLSRIEQTQHSLVVGFGFSW
ncbi:MAG: outer membrane protein transport protein [Planctomycetota bacterium]